jgi:hypothetical protein
MTTATRDALLKVDKILHDAGWGESDASLSEVSQQLERLSRTNYWPELCTTIREYYRKAYRESDEASPRNLM